MKIEYGPREKLEEKGARALSDSELIAILIKTGTNEMGVMELSNHILNEINSICYLNEFSVEELMNFKGIGKAKAMTIVSALELGYRIRMNRKKVKRIQGIENEVNLFKNDFLGETKEKCMVAFLSETESVLALRTISKGFKNATSFETKEILSSALRLNASKIIIAHNHPSGMEIPSEEDYISVSILEATLMEFQISIYDSLVYTENTCFSMKMAKKRIDMD